MEKEMSAQFCNSASLTVNIRCGERKDKGRIREVITDS